MEDVKVNKGTVISAIFLVAGCCVGGGMLALPVSTALIGFIPSVGVMLLCWAAMTGSALLLLEVNLWFEKGAHIITMSSRLLGRWAQGLCWLLYLFVCYGSLIAYTSGGSLQVMAFVNKVFGIAISRGMGSFIYAFIFFGLIYFGSKIVGRVNSILFVAMIVTYFALLGIGVPEMDTELYKFHQWHGVGLSIPVLLTSFSFQTMLPSLTPYLKRNVKALRLSIIAGTLIALVIYLAWQGFFFGIVPAWGSEGLINAMQKGQPPIDVLVDALQSRKTAMIAQYFAFFAIATCFIAIAMGLFDFLSDGLKIKEKGKGKFFLWILMLVPTLLIATKFERAFLVAMETSGGIGDSILNGMIPIAMVWVGRYRLKMTGVYRMMGGKVVLVGLFAFYLSVFIIEMLVITGVVAPDYQLSRTVDF